MVSAFVVVESRYRTERQVNMKPGVIFNIQRFSVQDGSGIRTTVFVKGCPLQCPWCSNPESQNTFAEVAHIDDLCNNCGRCVDVCERQAISLAEVKGVKIDRQRCDNCGKCVKACTQNALKLFGREIPVEDVISEIERDALYYRNSGGGVTISGGEPLSQPGFVSAIFKRCRELGIQTTLDTSGYGTKAALDMVLEYTDAVLFDLKIMNPRSHKSIIKVPNQTILRNMKRVVEKDIPLIVRIPLIPAITATEDNIAAIARFVKDIDPGLPVNILPYHRFGVNKYKMLDREYGLNEPSLQDEQLRSILKHFLSHGLACEIVK